MPFRETLIVYGRVAMCVTWAAGIVVEANRPPLSVEPPIDLQLRPGLESSNDLALQAHDNPFGGETAKPAILLEIWLRGRS